MPSRKKFSVAVRNFIEIQFVLKILPKENGLEENKMKLGGQINRSANSFNDSLNVKIGENSCGKLHDLLKTLLQNRTLEVKKITFFLSTPLEFPFFFSAFQPP